MNLEAWVDANCPGARTDGPDEFGVCCPVHKESKPSCYINRRNGLWKCHAKCGGGSIISLAKKLKVEPPEIDGASSKPGDAPVLYVPMAEVEQAEKRLWSKAGKEPLAFLAKRGIDKATIRQFRLGLEDGEEQRLWIPVFSGAGECLNVRRYDWLHIQKSKFLHYKPGYGRAHLWPAGVVERNEEVIVFEGEMDCLLAHALGLGNAVTSTGGAASWEDAFTRALAGKQVLICYDIDDAGRSGAAALLQRLRVVAASVVAVGLPISEPANGDFSDYAKSVDFSRGQVHQLFGRHRAAAKGAANRVRFNALAQSVPSHNATLALRAVVSGKDLTPFNVPAQAVIDCVPEGKVCNLCPLKALGGHADIAIPVTSKVTLQSVLANDAAVDRALREHLCIPGRCPGAQVAIGKTMPLWDVRLSADVDSGEEEGAEGARRAFSMVEMSTNQPYDLEVASVSDPKTQYSLLHILNSKTSHTALDAWRTDGKEELLRLWEPGPTAGLKRLAGKVGRDPRGLGK